MYATNFFETRILNLLRSTSVTAPTSMYIGLFLSNPEDTGGGTEVTYNGYARKEIKFNAPVVSGQGYAISNSEVITFAESPINVGNISYIGIFDSVVGGNMWLYGQLGTPINVQIGVSPIVRIGMIKYILTGNFNSYYKSKILNIIRGVNCAGITPYLALMTGDPDSGGTEFSGSGYARRQMVFTVPAEQVNGNSQISNSEVATSPEATGFWGTLSHVSIYDAVSNGYPFLTVALPSSYSMVSGSICQFRVGDFKININ